MGSIEEQELYYNMESLLLLLWVRKEGEIEQYSVF